METTKNNDFKNVKKIIISSELHLLTGLHIGSSSEFYGIGAVDNVVIRDPLTKEPIIPGSSLKGKIRSLLKKNIEVEDTNRLFGSTANGQIVSRLQFCDCFLSTESGQALKKLSSNLYMTEIKFENTINDSLVANPRQIERVPRGAIFDFNLIYTVLDEEVNVKKDISFLVEGLKLLCLDYLGGSGSRGYGKVCFKEFKIAT
jgi:CRISPR-associated protein Csm3